jgi:hypothetical protein
MSYYVNIKHPNTGATIQAIPNGKKESSPIGTAIEVLSITPGSNVERLWIKRGQVLKE